jgi:hypothetical protein
VLTRERLEDLYRAPVEMLTDGVTAIPRFYRAEAGSMPATGDYAARFAAMTSTYIRE